MEKKLTAEEISNYHKKEIPRTPPIGYKLFEPSNSFEELSSIQNHLKATGELLSYNKVQKLGSLSQAVWHPEMQKAEVLHQVGSCWSSMGHTIDKKLFLYPEEALYLLELGSLDLKYNDVSLSRQRAYSALLAPSTELNEEHYRVYSELSSNGYKVLRHVESNVLTKYEKQIEIHKAGVKSRPGSSMGKKYKPAEEPNIPAKKQNLESLSEKFPVKPKGNDEIGYLKELQFTEPYKSNEKSNLRVDYDVYLSDGKSSFKKTCVQLPKVRIVVHRGSDPMPDLKEFHHLAQEFEDEVPIIHAIAFPEYIAFYNIKPVSTPKCYSFEILS